MRPDQKTQIKVKTLSQMTRSKDLARIQFNRYIVHKKPSQCQTFGNSFGGYKISKVHRTTQRKWSCDLVN